MLSTEASRLIIQQNRATMILYENEVVTMLQRDPELWRQALYRGKYHNRNEKMMNQKATPASRRKNGDV